MYVIVCILYNNNVQRVFNTYKKYQYFLIIIKTKYKLNKLYIFSFSSFLSYVLIYTASLSPNLSLARYLYVYYSQCVCNCCVCA